MKSDTQKNNANDDLQYAPKRYTLYYLIRANNVENLTNCLLNSSALPCPCAHLGFYLERRLCWRAQFPVKESRQIFTALWPAIVRFLSAARSTGTTNHHI